MAIATMLVRLSLMVMLSVAITLHSAIMLCSAFCLPLRHKPPHHAIIQIVWIVYILANSCRVVYLSQS
jgi:hypothetical protein